MQYQVLLLEDIGSSRKGEIVKVKPGFARNFLLPEQKAVIVDKRTLRLQERLKEERAKQAVEDKKQSEKLAKQINELSFTTKVKVDPDGHMYGSVSASDIAKILNEHGLEINKRYVNLLHPIKRLGDHTIELVLKEGVKASFKLSVESEVPLAPRKEEPKQEAKLQEETKEAAEEENKPSE